MSFILSQIQRGHFSTYCFLGTDLGTNIENIDSVTESESDPDIEFFTNSYREDVKIRSESWPEICDKIIKSKLKADTIHGRKCEKASCNIMAKYLCQSCLKYCAFCEQHARLHQLEHIH